jgi:erythrocyte band 7 integral membrane protein
MMNNASVVPTTAVSDDRHELYERFLEQLGNLLGCLCILPGCPLNPYQVVSEGYVGLLLRLGRCHKKVRPGIYYINPMTSTLIPVSVQLQVVPVRGQNIMTKDNVDIGIDSVVYYKIVDVEKAVLRVQDITNALDQLTHTTLRDVLGRMTLQECLEHRNLLADSVREAIEKPTADWGVYVDSMLIKEIILTPDLKMNLSSAAQAKRLAESTVITAQAQVESAKLMRQASDILNSESAMQIRYLETMASIAKSENPKVLFLPTDRPVMSFGNQIMYNPEDLTDTSESTKLLLSQGK